MHGYNSVFSLIFLLSVAVILAHFVFSQRNYSIQFKENSFIFMCNYSKLFILLHRFQHASLCSLSQRMLKLQPYMAWKSLFDISLDFLLLLLLNANDLELSIEKWTKPAIIYNIACMSFWAAIQHSVQYVLVSILCHTNVCVCHKYINYIYSYLSSSFTTSFLSISTCICMRSQNSKQSRVVCCTSKRALWKRRVWLSE